MKQLVAVALFVVIGVGCSKAGTGISGASAVPSVTPTVLDGKTGQPVAAAVSGSGDITVTALGFFTLKTHASPQVILWPADAYLSAAYTKAAIYGQKDPGTLYRMAPGVSVVGITAGAGFTDGPAAERLATAAEVISAAGALHYQVGIQGRVQVSVYVDANDPGFVTIPNAAALTYTQAAGDGIIQAAKVVFRSSGLGTFYSWDNLQHAATHELGHTSGLNHLDPGGEQGIMSASAAAYSYLDFTDREKLVMKLQYIRRPGTVLSGTTENEFAVAGSSAGATWHLVCAQ